MKNILNEQGNSDLGKERMKERLWSGKKGLHDPSVADVGG